MDGNGSTAWTINHSLTVNTQSIESGSQQFDGTLNMNAGAIGRLTVNLADPSAAWTMSGTMNLAGFGVLTTTRIAGSRMILTGELNMGTGIAQITADTSLNGANVSIAAGGTLRMLGRTTLDIDTNFSGSGVLHNGAGGTMIFDSGAALFTVGLTNSGIFTIVEEGGGVAGVNRVEFAPSSVWAVEIGGYAAGDADRLLVTGAAGAALGGVLDVSLLNLGMGFAPQIGDEFRILFALDGMVSGTFVNDPVSLANGLTYEWTVIYNPSNVTLRLDNIIPTPSSMALLSLGGLIAARRRRA